ncbi:MAG: hypothetical protein V1816_08035 [Pseudomonadota bacterium]
MNDLLNKIEALAARARLEKPPTSNAAPGIEARLRRETPPLRQPLLWLTAGSLLAAILIAALNFDLVIAIDDPILDIFISTVSLSL